MKKLVLLFVLLLLPLSPIFAQAKFATGVVISDEDRLPVIGASVLIKGTKTGVTTDADGKFRILLPASAKLLVISAIGSVTQEVRAGTDLKVILKSSITSLDEVVAVAYGTAKRQSLVGAQASVGAKDLAKRPITNISAALSGVAAGVQALTSSGQPGASASIRLRGTGSVNASSAPIYVVDGAIYDGAIGDIAPSDIQSVSVLKDAASTALYGSSAGNGVILITTKSGSRAAEGKPSFNFTMNQGFTRPGQRQYRKLGAEEFYPLRWTQWYNYNKYDLGYSDEKAGAVAAYDVWNALRYNPFSGIKSVYVKSGDTYELTQNPASGVETFPAIVLPNGQLNSEITGIAHPEDYDWEKALYRVGHRQEYTFSGGLNTKNFKSFVSFNYLNEEGYRIQTGFERFSVRANLSYDINRYVSVGTNTSFVKTHSESPKSLGNTQANSFSFISYIAPVYPIHQHEANGDYVVDPLTGNHVYDHSMSRPYRGRFNPIEESYLDLNSFDRNTVSSRSFLTINLLKGLKFTTNVSYDFIQLNSKLRYNNVMGDQPQGVLDIDGDQYQTVTFNQLLNYNKSFGDHNFEALVGHESYAYQTDSFSGRKSNAFLSGLDQFANYTEMKSLTSGHNEYKKEGYFARLNYDYDGRYNLSASFRRDGSSRFAQDYRWGNFWAVGAGWNLHRESFLSPYKWINELKLRASVGQTGVDGLSSYYPYQILYGMNNNNMSQPGLRLSTYGNPELQWETQTSYDLALEFGLFGRIRGTVELFNKESKDLIFDYPLPLSSGISSINRNIGKVRNYGLEFNVDATLLQTNALRWGFRVNGTVAKNKIVSLPDINKENGIELSYHKYVEGGSLYDYYLKRYMGVNPENGKALYLLDQENYPNKGLKTDPTLTENSDYGKKEFVGTSIPDLYGGFGTDLSYRGVDLSIDFSYQLGGKTLDAAYQTFMGSDKTGGLAAHVDLLNAWKKPGDTSDIPGLTASPSDYSTSLSDRFLISSSALMLRSVSLGYTLPKSLTSKFHLGNVRLSVAAENLVLFSKRRGLNPFGQYDGVVTSSTGYGYARTITTSLSINL